MLWLTLTVAPLTKSLVLLPIAEGTGIDLDEGSMKGPAAAIRPPAALLALEDAGVQGEGHGDGEDGNFKASVFGGSRVQRALGRGISYLC